MQAAAIMSLLWVKMPCHKCKKKGLAMVKARNSHMSSVMDVVLWGLFTQTGPTGKKVVTGPAITKSTHTS